MMRKLATRLFPKTVFRLIYLKSFKGFCHLRKPVCFYEKIAWLNFYSKNPLRSQYADKLKVRDYLKSLDMEQYLTPLYGVYNKASEIDFSHLPEQFVLKCNHGANYNIFCSDKNKFDVSSAVRKLDKWMKEDYSLYYAEMHYRKIKPVILCEKYLGDDLVDYKVYCINKEPIYVMVCTGRQHNDIRYMFYTFDWVYKPFTVGDKDDPLYPRPSNLEEIYHISKKLAQGFEYVRVDFYIIDGKLVFGEMTFTPGACLYSNTIKEVSIEMGEMLELPEKQPSIKR